MSSPSHFGVYDVKELLGGGSFATVFRAIRLDTGIERALKQIKLTPIMDDARELKTARDEVEMMRKLPEHCNIVKLFDSCEAEGFILNKGAVLNDSTHSLYLELEYCGGGTLQKQISSAFVERKMFSEGLIMDWFRQLASGLSFIHENGIVHRDIKPLNIFLTKDLSTVKFGDFGISKSTKTYHVKGTPPYMAPEIFNSHLPNAPYESYTPNAKEDVWSLGVVLFELVALTVPFTGRDIGSLVRNIETGQRAPLPIDHYSSDLRRLIDWLLAIDPNKRPSIKDVLANPFVTTGQKSQPLPVKVNNPVSENEVAMLREEITALRKVNEIFRSENEQADIDLAKLRAEIASLRKELQAVKSEQSCSETGLVTSEAMGTVLIRGGASPNFAVPLRQQQDVSPSNSSSNFDYENWFKAADNGDLQQLKALCLPGLNINAKNEKAGWDKDYTALHYAASKDYKEIAAFLLMKGARVDERDANEQTPLLLASIFGNVNIFQVLVQFGADINAKDNGGYTPLILASWNNRHELVVLLTKHPRFNTLNHKNKDNKTALQCAVDYKYERIVEFLKSIGATA